MSNNNTSSNSPFDAIRKVDERGNEAHYITGKRIREFIKEDGDTLPENLANPEKSIQQLQREEQRRIERQRQPSLFDQNEE